MIWSVKQCSSIAYFMSGVVAREPKRSGANLAKNKNDLPYERIRRGGCVESEFYAAPSSNLLILYARLAPFSAVLHSETSIKSLQMSVIIMMLAVNFVLCTYLCIAKI